MNKPAVLLLDTGAIIAIVNKSERELGDQIIDYMRHRSPTSRHLLSASAVELFYKVKKLKLRPDTVMANMKALSITYLPAYTGLEQKIFDSYSSLNYSVNFDFADYYICSLAINYFSDSEIMTIDKKDIQYAYAEASKQFKLKNTIRFIAFPV